MKNKLFTLTLLCLSLKTNCMKPLKKIKRINSLVSLDEYEKSKKKVKGLKGKTKVNLNNEIRRKLKETFLKLSAESESLVRRMANCYRDNPENETTAKTKLTTIITNTIGKKRSNLSDDDDNMIGLNIWLDKKRKDMKTFIKYLTQDQILTLQITSDLIFNKKEEEIFQ